MLVATSGAILVRSIDRPMLPAVLHHFHLSDEGGGLLTSLSFLGTFLGWGSCATRATPCWTRSTSIRSRRARP